MSHIYIQEPRTEGKVILSTTLGDIELEFWPKECPKATRNFIQLCLEGYYNNTIFHRIVRDFIAVGGDPTGTGLGGDSIYGKPFRDEFHSRLRFNRRGLLAMANLAKDDNNSQFLFTMGPATELQNKHTIFGRVIGDTIYNMIKLNECQVDKNERPLNVQKIFKATVIENPFRDIVPRSIDIKKEGTNDKQLNERLQDPKEEALAKKDFKLLSFGDEAEDEEQNTQEDVDDITFKTRGKSKSSHVILDDPTLSAEPAIKKESIENVVTPSKHAVPIKIEKNPVCEPTLSEMPIKKSKKKRLDEIHKELERIKQELNDQNKQAGRIKKESPNIGIDCDSPEGNKLAAEILAEETRELYEKMKRIPKKGSRDRDSQTLAMIKKFKQELSSTKASTSKSSDDCEPDSSSWLDHEFNVENDLIIAKDANLKTEDWYSIEDPRNQMNKRRREHKSSSHRSHHRSSRRSPDRSPHRSSLKSSSSRRHE